MQVVHSENQRGKRLYYFLALSCIIWGLIILPIMGQIFWELPFSVFSCFLGILFSLVFTILPIELRNNWPQEGKEYQILFYPLITIPIGFLGYYVKYHLIW